MFLKIGSSSSSNILEYSRSIKFLECVVLLDGIDVKTLQLHHRFNMSFECVELLEPENVNHIRISIITLIKNSRCIIILLKLGRSY